MNVTVDSGSIQIGSCSCCSQTYRTRAASTDLFGEDYATDYPDTIITPAVIARARAALMASLAALDAIERRKS